MPEDARGDPSGAAGTPAEATIEDYFSEDRVFPPPDDFRRQAVVTDPGCTNGPKPTGAVLGRAGRRPRLVPDLGLGARVGPTLRPLVRRWHPQRLLQLPRPPRGRRPRRQGGLPLGGRARRHPHHHLRSPAGRGVEVRQRVARPGRRTGRPGGHLHADDPRAAGGHAGLHPDRCRPLGGVRRVLVRCPPRQDPRRSGPGGRHRRRRVASRGGVCPEAPCGRGRVRVAVRRARGGGRAGRRRSRPPRRP